MKLTPGQILTGLAYSCWVVNVEHVGNFDPGVVVHSDLCMLAIVIVCLIGPVRLELAA